MWGPFGVRTERRMRFENHIQAQDGSYRAVEMPGPRDLETWRACYHVFKAAAVMLKIAHPAVLERYESLFEQRCRRFPGAWHIMVLADMRCRCEFFGVEKRRLREMQMKCPTLSDYDPDMPWNSVIQSAADDIQYWQRNVEMPALEFTLGRHSRDAGTGSPSSGGHARPPVGQHTQKQPDVPASWKAVNLQGTEICRKWNASPGGCERNCPQRRAHQCAICLNTHRACQHDASKTGTGKGSKGSGGKGNQGGGPKKRARKTKKSGN